MATTDDWDLGNASRIREVFNPSLPLITNFNYRLPADLQSHRNFRICDFALRSTARFLNTETFPGYTEQDTANHVQLAAERTCLMARSLADFRRLNPTDQTRLIQCKASRQIDT